MERNLLFGIYDLLFAIYNLGWFFNRATVNNYSPVAIGKSPFLNEIVSLKIPPALCKEESQN